jgi:hypothetical protein
MFVKSLSGLTSHIIQRITQLATGSNAVARDLREEER